MDAIAELVSRLGREAVTRPPADVPHLGRRPGAVVRPTSSEEVVELVRWAREHRVALVPSGGRTGLSGGADAHEGEVILSLEKMNRILDFNRADRTVRCQAGVVTQLVQEFVRDQGYFFPVDFASRGSSQVGGNVATNAGGVRVVRYGSFREWVAGLEFVTGAGQRVRDLGLVKNATGYDFRHLMIGSEGTLGVITEVLLKVTTPLQDRQVYLLSFSDDSFLMSAFEALRDATPLLAFEVFTEAALRRVLARRREAGRPAGHPFSESASLSGTLNTGTLYALVEVESLDPSVLEGLFERGWISDALCSQSARQGQELWGYREEISESLAPSRPYKWDVSVRVSRVAAWVREMKDLLAQTDPELEVIWFGHLGDGNLHINVLKPPGWEAERFREACSKVSERLFELLQKHGGSVSAEHGIGLLKREALRYSRSPYEIELMRGIKRVFDPDGILNPGKIFV